MAREVVMPRLGWDMEAGTLLQWLEADGSPVRAGEVICIVESDKAEQEVESFDSGIPRIPPDSPPPGARVPVGTRLAYILQPGERGLLVPVLGDVATTPLRRLAAESAALAAAARAGTIGPNALRGATFTVTNHLAATGIPAEAPLWSKACNAAGVFGVSVVVRASIPRLFGTPDLVRAYLGLVRETAALAAACGVPVEDYTNFPMRTYVTRPDEETVAERVKTPFLASTAGPEPFPSMTQDLLAGRALEVDQVFDDLVQRADRAGVAVPRLRFVRDLIRGIDPGRHPA